MVVYRRARHLYVHFIERRSATLRDIAGLLHMRDSALSTPTTLHTFRIVSFDERKNIWASREAGRGVTRLSRAAFDDILDDVLSKDEIDSSDQLFRQTVEKVRPQMPAEADDEASRITLDQLHFTEGDILDVAIVKSSLGAADRLDPYPRHYTARKSDR
jgi:hypothetical protein